MLIGVPNLAKKLQLFCFTTLLDISFFLSMAQTVALNLLTRISVGKATNTNTLLAHNIEDSLSFNHRHKNLGPKGGRWCKTKTGFNFLASQY